MQHDNAIFGKIGRTACEEVTLELLRSKCIPVLIYGLECFSLPKSDLKSLDFAVTRFLMICSGHQIRKYYSALFWLLFREYTHRNKKEIHL